MQCLYMAQVRVRLGAANSSGKRRAAARKADGALPQELSAQQMPNSPSTANRKTGRTAMGPCEPHCYPMHVCLNNLCSRNSTLPPDSGLQKISSVDLMMSVAAVRCIAVLCRFHHCQIVVPRSFPIGMKGMPCHLQGAGHLSRP